jgi:hypothetical protein
MQEHPNNGNSEMIFVEYLEYLMRVARLKNSSRCAPANFLYVYGLWKSRVLNARSKAQELVKVCSCKFSLCVWLVEI